MQSLNWNAGSKQKWENVIFEFMCVIPIYWLDSAQLYTSHNVMSFLPYTVLGILC